MAQAAALTTVNARGAILEKLEQSEYSPFELMEALERERHLNDASVKSAILELLQEMQIEFGPQQKLKRVAR